MIHVSQQVNSVSQAWLDAVLLGARRAWVGSVWTRPSWQRHVLNTGETTQQTTEAHDALVGGTWERRAAPHGAWWAGPSPTTSGRGRPLGHRRHPDRVPGHLRFPGP